LLIATKTDNLTLKQKREKKKRKRKKNIYNCFRCAHT